MFKITQDSIRITSQISVFIILSFAQVLRLSFIPAIEYSIPFTTINSTAASPARYVKYFIIAHIMLMISVKPVGTSQLSDQHPGMILRSVVIGTSTAHTLV